MIYPLAPNGVFWTIQGEGALMGEAMAFVRLAGCSVGCPQCDTDYRVARRVALPDLMAEIRGVIPKAHTWPWIWITGGEPTDHDLQPLIGACIQEGRRVALATSGVRVAPHNVHWISVSPHSLDCVQRNGHELKVTPQLNGLSWDVVEQIGRWSFPYRYIQPLAWGNANGTFTGVMEERQSVKACLEFVRRHPGWRMGIQAHKYWEIP